MKTLSLTLCLLVIGMMGCAKQSKPNPPILKYEWPTGAEFGCTGPVDRSEGLYDPAQHTTTITTFHADKICSMSFWHRELTEKEIAAEIVILRREIDADKFHKDDYQIHGDGW
jgi:hypothetical protein